MTGMEFRSFRLTQLCFNCCSLFYSNSPLHVSVVRPSSFGNIYITNDHGWHEFQAFPSNATLLQYLFTISFQFSATWFGRTTIFMCHFIHHKMSWLAWGSGVSVWRNSVAIVVQYFIPILRYMIQSYDHLQVQIYTSQIILTGVSFRGFRLMELRFNSCSLFYSNSPQYDSVVRSFSRAFTYITKYHDWREFQGFPSNASPLQLFFTILFQFFAPCFGRTTIFMWKYIPHKWSWLAWGSGVSL
jgi:hypothetical protein